MHQPEGLACLPGLIPDIKNIYDVYFEAFRGEPILDILFPTGIDDKFRDLHTQGTSEYWKQSKVQYTIKCVDSMTGEIVGMGLWDVLIEGRSQAEIEDPGVTWLEGKERERAESVLGPLWEKRRQIMGKTPHICEYTFTIEDLLF